MTKGYERKTTAEIKKALNKEFNHKFSVRKGTGTASSWTNISWTDGPTDVQVRKFTSSFNDTGKDDITTDLWCGSQYTSENRHLSDKYTWQLVGNIDLRTEPTIEDQMENYFDLLACRNNYPKMKRDGMAIMVETPGLHLDGLEWVRQSLAAQDIQTYVSQDQSRMVATSPEI